MAVTVTTTIEPPPTTKAEFPLAWRELTEDGVYEPNDGSKDRIIVINDLLIWRDANNGHIESPGENYWRKCKFRRTSEVCTITVKGE